MNPTTFSLVVCNCENPQLESNIFVCVLEFDDPLEKFHMIHCTESALRYSFRFQFLVDSSFLNSPSANVHAVSDVSSVCTANKNQAKIVVHCQICTPPPHIPSAFLLSCFILCMAFNLP